MTTNNTAKEYIRKYLLEVLQENFLSPSNQPANLIIAYDEATNRCYYIWLSDNYLILKNQQLHYSDPDLIPKLLAAVKGTQYSP